MRDEEFLDDRLPDHELMQQLIAERAFDDTHHDGVVFDAARVRAMIEQRVASDTKDSRHTENVLQGMTATNASERVDGRIALRRELFGRQTLREEPFLGKRTLRRILSLARQTSRRTATYVSSSLVVAGIVTLTVLRVGHFNHTQVSLPVHAYTTVAGQHATVTLADGSRAQLGPMTTLTVTSEPTDRGMKVHVSGEALFTVIHRSGASFQVHTANAVTRVLGTTFLVRRYPADLVTRVVVSDGRVSLSGRRSNVGSILAARTLGAIDDSGHVVVTPDVAVDDYIHWIAGRLVFRDAPIRDIIAELSRAYDVEFRISDSLLADQHLNWTIPVTQQSLSDILTVLGGMLDAHPVRAGRIITFVPGRATSRQSSDAPSFTPERQYGR